MRIWITGLLLGCFVFHSFPWGAVAYTNDGIAINWWSLLDPKHGKLIDSVERYKRIHLFRQQAEHHQLTYLKHYFTRIAPLKEQGVNSMVFAAPGRRPRRLPTQMKKNNVNK